MELRHIRYFVAVAEEKNFTRAAARLGIGQPPLSQQIRDLEGELGAALFHRVPHGAELTEAGQAFLEEARGILAGSERAKIAVQRASAGQVGRLSLGLTVSAVFNPAFIATMRAFRQRWPGVLLSLDEMNTMRLLERLVREEFDAIFIRPGIAELDGIQLYRLPDEPMVVALPAHHPLARSRSLPLEALAREPFILYPPVVGISLHHEVVAACQACSFDPIEGQIAPQISSGLSLVAAGLGVSIVPKSIMQIRVPDVVYRPIQGLGPIARLALASRQGRKTAILTNFIQILHSSWGGKTRHAE